MKIFLKCAREGDFLAEDREKSEEKNLSEKTIRIVPIKTNRKRLLNQKWGRITGLWLL